MSEPIEKLRDLIDDHHLIPGHAGYYREPDGAFVHLEEYTKCKLESILLLLERPNFSPSKGERGCGVAGKVGNIYVYA